MLDILLIRHGQTDWNRDRRIMGRRPIPLNITGRRDSMALCAILRDLPLDAVWTSPVLRAVQTARIMAKGKRVRIREAPEVAEIDYGEWVGRRFEDVKGEEAYITYHTTPMKAQAPGGEAMRSVKRRAIGFIEGLRKNCREGKVAVVSHADVIKLILVRYLDIDPNEMFRLRIDNGSISLLSFSGTSERVLAVNSLPSPIGLFSRTDQNLFAPTKK